MIRSAQHLHKVIIVSPHFPPSTLAGVHRARHLAQHLPAHGWDPIIVHVDERFYPEESDPALAGLLRDNLKRVRVTAMPTRLARKVGLGDVGIRSYPWMGDAVIRAAREHGARAVMITGSPFYPMLLARRIKHQTGLPILLDFQDPWVTAVGSSRPAFSKGRVAHQLSALLEPMAVRHADFITSVSDTQNTELAARYPSIDPERMAALPIGGDPADFDALRRSPPVAATHPLDPAKINFSYVGTFMPRSTQMMEAVLAGLAHLKAHKPDLASRIALNFVGTSNQPNAGAAPQVAPIAEKLGVTDLVHETPRRVRYLEALSLLANSDGLMMIGSDEPHYTASKIYPNLMAGRPYLSLFHAASSAHKILTDGAGGRTFSFENLADLPALAPAIADAFEAIATQPEVFPSVAPESYQAFTANSIAASYAAIFDRMAA